MLVQVPVPNAAVNNGYRKAKIMVRLVSRMRTASVDISGKTIVKNLPNFNLMGAGKGPLSFFVRDLPNFNTLKNSSTYPSKCYTLTHLSGITRPL